MDGLSFQLFSGWQHGCGWSDGPKPAPQRKWSAIAVGYSVHAHVHKHTHIYRERGFVMNF